MISIKKKIGQRISEARKAKGLTQKGLGELADGIKQTRINNWENGIRAPGPMEIKQLSKALEVSPAYLMCLTDEPEVFKETLVQIPLLEHEQIHKINKNIEVTCNHYIPLNSNVSNKIGPHAFAIKVQDDSMSPELKLNDILIVDSELQPAPGNLVVAKLDMDEEVMIRRYKQFSIAEKFNRFRLIATNSNWAEIEVDSNLKGQIVGVVVYLLRNILN